MKWNKPFLDEIVSDGASPGGSFFTISCVVSARQTENKSTKIKIVDKKITRFDFIESSPKVTPIIIDFSNYLI